MSSITHRQYLQMGIIGHCLMYDSFTTVGAVLTSRSFTGRIPGTELEMALVFQAIERSYLKQPITPLTVGHYLKQHHGVALYAWPLAQCVNATERLSRNIKFYSLHLLELDMRQRLLATIQPYEKAATKAGDFAAAKNYKYLRELITPAMNDVFHAFEEAKEFLEYMDLTDCLDQVQELSGFIPLKVAKIKRGAHVHELMQQLGQLTTGGPNPTTREALKYIHQIVMRAIVKTDLTPTDIAHLKNIAAHE